MSSHKRIFVTTLAATLALAWPGVRAQAPVFTTGTPAELAVARQRGLERVRAIAQLKGIDGPTDLVVTRVEVDRLSMAHTRVQQYFRGVPVFGGQAIAHLRANGEAFGETDDLIPNIAVNTTPTLSAAAAIAVAVADYGCSACLTETPVASLWILREAGVDHLVYRVDLRRIDGSAATAMPVRFVDAHGGFIVRSYDNLQTGTGASLYSGTVAIGTSYNAPNLRYLMENLIRRVGTFDARNSTSQVFRFLDTDDVWDAAAQRAGVDAHYGAETFLGYLQNAHGRNGLDGTGGPHWTTAFNDGLGVISSVVHYGVNYNNAFWTGSVMVYGDGDGAVFGPLVTLDIAGHEMMHGVTQFTADLTFSGESGALSESWSDVFGAMNERAVRGDNANIWLIGEDAWTPSTPGDAVRYMSDPHQARDSGYTANDDPDHYSERYTGTLDNGGVHINSGIANKAFYLLAVGGTHHLGGSMTGIGTTSAALIWYDALAYMTASTTFAGARTATLSAAAARYGSGSAQHQGVAMAWCLVGVGACVGGVTVTPTSGLVTTEAGGTTTFNVVLTSQPTDNVTIPLSSNDTTEGTVSVASVTFTTANWNVAQTVTVTGVNDALDDGDISYSILTGMTISTDPSYDTTINPSDVSLTNTDDDTASPTMDLAVDFGAPYGLWTRVGTTWSRVHTLSPVGIVTGDLDGNSADDLVVNFGTGFGVWAWMNHATWRRIHSLSPSQMVTGDFDGNGRDEVVLDFTGHGVWRWSDSGTWTAVHSLNASRLAVGQLDGLMGDELIVDFPGFGIYIRYNNSSWRFLHPVHARAILTADLDGSGRDDLIVNFGSPHGLWVFRNNATWARLHTVSPAHLAAGRLDPNAQADLVVDFGPAFGTYTLRNNATWVALHSLSTEGIVLANRDGVGGDEIIIDFGPTHGLWQRTNDSTWQQLHPISPEEVAVGRFH
jgi:Zn-dependent metalloprotease